MSKLDDILNADEYWDEGHGDVSVFQPDLAKPAIKDLFLELITSATDTDDLADGEPYSYVDGDELRQKVAEL